MSSAKFTLIGAYQYFNTAGDDLFKNLRLPEGLSADTLSSNILLKGGEFEVQNADPFFIQSAIAIWSNVYYDTFDRWVKVLSKEYDPIENYDRREDWTDTTDQEGTGSSRSTGTLDSTVHDTISETDEHTKSAFDSSSYQPYEKIQKTGNNTNTNDTDTTDNTNTTMTNDVEFEHSGRIHGNIGVTTSQQMVLQELDLGYWNVYERITELFLREFVIPVYD